MSACKYSAFAKFTPPERSIPLNKQRFLLDQRSERKMAIGTLDLKKTNKNKKTLARRLALLKQEGVVEYQEPLISNQEETSQE